MASSQLNRTASAQTETVTLEELKQVIVSRQKEERQIVALAGPPGSGKSTTAELLVYLLNSVDGIQAAILPMDGFHFDDIVLKDRGLLSRKGAPQTFDVSGLAHLLKRLRDNGEYEIAVPVFDRDLELSRGSARLIAQDINVLIVEGNYLLLRDAPWVELSDTFDIAVEIRVDEETLRARLKARWEAYCLPQAEIEAKVEENDLPNGRYVMAHAKPADFVIST